MYARVSAVLRENLLRIDKVTTIFELTPLRRIIVSFDG